MAKRSVAADSSPVTQSDPRNVLAIDPFHTGSHRDFARGIQRHSIHQWDFICGTGVHWKWRMRSFPVMAAEKARQIADDRDKADEPPFDSVWVTDMLDLPAWLGLIRRHPISRLPVTLYFHENQWAYPTAEDARPDHHYGYTNLLSAMAADQLVFNSQMNRDSFFDGCQRFLRRMPDSRREHDLESKRSGSHVISPGFEPTPEPSRPTKPDDETRPLTIGWVSRWESDKRPDRLADFLDHWREIGVDFRLVLLGPRRSSLPAAHERIVESFREQILHDGFAESRAEYVQWLSQIDVVVSTADHEFFGIAMCEAIDAGAVPLVPRGLGYADYVGDDRQYDGLADATAKLLRLRDRSFRQSIADQARRRIEHLDRKREIGRLDGVMAMPIA